MVLDLVPLYIRDLYQCTNVPLAAKEDDRRLFRLVSSSERRANEMARLVAV